MEKVELYRQVFSSFKERCSKGEQSCSFSAYCREHGVCSSQMRQVLKEEFKNVRSLPGYQSAGAQYRSTHISKIPNYRSLQGKYLVIYRSFIIFTP